MKVGVMDSDAAQVTGRNARSEIKMSTNYYRKELNVVSSFSVFKVCQPSMGITCTIEG